MSDYEVKVIPKFDFKLKKFQKYLLLLEYFTYAKGDINGRIIRYLF